MRIVWDVTESSDGDQLRIVGDKGEITQLVAGHAGQAPPQPPRSAPSTA